MSSLQTFFLAMGMYPEVMQKAQAQIDEVVGKGRLPEFSDIENMPYIQAIVKELLRWQPVTPLGKCELDKSLRGNTNRPLVTAVAHKASEDDEYRGYYIPKGTVVLGNSWYG